jgi:hypothetical protein
MQGSVPCWKKAEAQQQEPQPPGCCSAVVLAGSSSSSSSRPTADGKGMKTVQCPLLQVVPGLCVGVGLVQGVVLTWNEVQHGKLSWPVRR